MVVEESLPGLVAAAGSRAILTDGGIRDFDSEFGQFGLDAFAAPGGIAGPHLPNEVDELAVRGGSAAAGKGFPAPKQAQAQPMPSDDRLGLAEEQALLPVRPNRPQCEPQETIRLTKFELARLPAEHRELMPKRQIFE